MTIEKLCDGIGLDSELKGEILNYNMTEKVYGEFQRLLKEDRKEFVRGIESREDSHMFALVLYCMLAVDVYEDYMKRGISDEIYMDTFRDFKIWSQVCEKKFHEQGLTEYEWLTLPLELKIVRLGRLQFEPAQLEEDVQVNGEILKVGTKVLDVHIPEGEPLSDEACEEAFRKADAFFGKEYKAYVCTSWLVSPEIKKLVSPQSNIAKFQARFHVYGTIYPFRQAEERVFGEILSDKSLYSEESSLQKMLKAYVADGKDPGMGCGVIFR